MACASNLVKVTGMRRVDDGEPPIIPNPPFYGGRPVDPPPYTPPPPPISPPPETVICFISISLPPEIQSALSVGCDYIILVP